LKQQLHHNQSAYIFEKYANEILSAAGILDREKSAASTLEKADTIKSAAYILDITKLRQSCLPR